MTSVIEQATRRLEQLTQSGVAVPWSAAGLSQPQPHARRSAASNGHAAAGFAHRLHEAASASSPAARVAEPDGPELGSGGTVSIDSRRLEDAGLLVPSQKRSALAEQFRDLKWPLLRNARGKDAAAKRLPLIMVTSALPGEGKTFCAINLAMSMAAEIDTSVLLVDADVVRPVVLERLGLKANYGLLDVLMRPELDLSSAVLKTNIPKFSILPAGTASNLSSELLASEAMEELLVSLIRRYPDHVVVFDTPPLLLANEAKVLASRVGQVVLVVEASNTPRSVVSRAFAAVEQCPIVMSVLNKAAQPPTPEGYGYYYG